MQTAEKHPDKSFKTDGFALTNQHSVTHLMSLSAEAGVGDNYVTVMQLFSHNLLFYRRAKMMSNS